MRTAYAYLRFSTPEQILGDSVRRQTSQTTDWCERNGVHLDKSLSFEDLGVSAFKGKHVEEGALGVFFKFVGEGKIKRGSYLVIEALDRFSRENPFAAAGRLFDLIKLGITVVTADDGREYSEETLGGGDIGPMVLLMIKLSQSHAESVRKSQRIGPAWKNKKDLARSEGIPLTSRCPEWLELRDGRFHPRKERVDIVRRIFQETIDGFGRRAIVARLNGEPVEPFKAGQKWKNPDRAGGWQTSSVARILNNRAVLGEYQPHTGKAGNRVAYGEPIANYYPKVIDEAIFWRAQSAMQERRQQSSGRRGDKGAHLLRGLARCSNCRSPMHIVNKGPPPKGGIYLSCSANRRNTGCENDKSWRVDQLEEALLLCLTSFKTRSFLTEKDETNRDAEGIDAMKGELGELESRADNLLGMVERGDKRAETRYLELSAEIEKRKAAIEGAEKELGIRQSDPGDEARLAEILKLSTDIFTLTGPERLEARTRLSSLIRRMVHLIECDPDRGPYAVLAIDTKLWHVTRPTEGAFAYQIDLPAWGVEEPPPRLLFLLAKNPSADARDAFFRKRGGYLLSPEGSKSFFPDRAKS